MHKRILVVDNYDSFTHNVAHALAMLSLQRLDVVVVDDPCLTAEFLSELHANVVGPGPGSPSESSALTNAIELAFALEKPLLGICLGMQAMASCFGASIVPASRPVHGELSAITHDGTGVFSGLPSPFQAMRYHSLCVARTPLPPRLRANAFSEDGVIQGIRDSKRAFDAVQFHPESFLSEHGNVLLANFVNRAGDVR